MNASSPDGRAPTPRLLDLARGARFCDRDLDVRADDLIAGAALADEAPRLEGKSVLLSVSTQVHAAVGMLELDGLVCRLVVAPADLARDHLAAVIDDAGVDFIVTDTPEKFEGARTTTIRLTLPLGKTDATVPRRHETQWTLLTSGTSGRPKMVAHSLAALAGAIPPRTKADESVVWATFYDIRRYGGLQMFLRAMIGGTPIVLTSVGESLVDHLRRLGAAGVTSISGTPSHWRRVLMTAERGAFAPAYVRLSGEIADQNVLDALRAAFPKASIGHAYASTEAGVAFAVDDGREGFPVSLVETPRNEVVLRIDGGTLKIRSPRTASRYIGPDAPRLFDSDGFVDTGDLVERRGDRFVFVGRRGGIINVGGLKVNPEEVESVINAHPAVRMSLVRAKKNPVTGALVAADIVLENDARAETVRDSILELCAKKLERHKAPAILRFVPSLPLTPAGKLRRDMTPAPEESADA
ncbi:MAG: acyl--CoA ligase [Hyphomicrobiales bacterium]|nr:acyl--CoA ligase [Hyphomicrobiales bacterium]